MSRLLCVYCASSDRLDPKYPAVAEELGREMVRRGWGLVYGGGRTGLMGAVARAVKESGGRVVGVIPEFMKVRELAYDEADELVTVITMRERKLLMETRADAFVPAGRVGHARGDRRDPHLAPARRGPEALRVPEPGRFLRPAVPTLRPHAGGQLFPAVEPGALPRGRDRP